MCKAQTLMLTPEERAIMHHVVVKSPALERNLGHLFEFTGDTVYFVFDTDKETDSIIDYDSIEKSLVYEPSQLKIYDYELVHQRQGLLNELSTKMALQSLYEELKRKDEIKPEGVSDTIYQAFLGELSKNLPDKAVKIKKGQREAISKVIDLLDPNMIFKDRVNKLREMQGFNLVEQQQVLDVVHRSIQTYIQKKSYEYFLKIGGKRGNYQSTLLAAGDGSGTSGLLNERELIYKGKNKLGSSKGVGLFTYDSKIKSGDKNVQRIVASSTSVREFSPYKDSYTNVHFSMWGFNFRRQSTVVISREGNAYVLYASKITKELSPDSTFGKGNTVHANIHKLEHVSIPAVDEEINGKDGLKDRVKHHEGERSDVLLKIKETEMDLNEHRYAQAKNQKKIKYLQERLSNLYTRKAQVEKNLAQAKEELKIEEERLQRFRTRLEELKFFFGDFQMSYTKFGYVYTFEDGCTFNSFTQDFVIPDSLKSEDFSVRIIATGPDAMSDFVDEVQLQVGITKGEPEDIDPHNFNLELNDVFASDQFEIDRFVLHEDEVYEVSKMLNLLLVNDWDLSMNLVGGGVGVMSGGKIVSGNAKELDQYPGESDEEKLEARNGEEFKPFRTTNLGFTYTDSGLRLLVESYTDAVKSNFSKKNIKVKPVKEKYPDLSENEMLSAFRTFFTTEKFMGELMRAAYFNFEGKDKSKLMAHLKKALEKSYVVVKGTKVSYQEYSSVVHKEMSYYSILEEKFKQKEEEYKNMLQM